MRAQPHPDLEQLDRLRAGLLDEQPASRAALEQHMAHCPACRERNDWRPLQPNALGPELDAESLSLSLQKARVQAMRTEVRARHHGLVPYASAALLLLAVFVGVWMIQTDTDNTQQLAVQDTEDVPDIYEDLDFYLWLANQKDSGNGNESVNPNNT